ncbi:uncharacterized protein LOC126899643 [Daktulosphaira vitifoliae]|uniref:uncharacterized protein LOC126899643 n=1 Tax=Daktulosphaira vitifoliae TaxID=58002 RepID=UPI0021AA8430|nr:uncharacterized protein LOC126899643 [Daktulosphaira vitifoliae]
MWESNILVIWIYLTVLLPLNQTIPADTEQTECDHIENYDELVTISSEQPYIVKKNKWCIKIPPRCSEDKTEFRTVQKNVTVNKTRVIKQCCKGYMRLNGSCVNICDQSQCPDVVCREDYQKCWCNPGFTGLLCLSKCIQGTWGDGCLNFCNNTCNNSCDHKTGYCHSEIKIKFNENATNDLIKNEKSFFSSVTSDNLLTVNGNENSTTATTTMTQIITIQSNTTSTAAKDVPATKPTNGSQGSYYRDLFMTVTNAKATVYKYTTYDHNDLIKKLIWISSLTVATLAMVFVIILVVFFKCITPPVMTERPKQEPSTSADSKNDTYKISFSMNPILDRYTKPPSNSGTKEAMLVPPETFCPVFKAPYYTADGCDIYDYPQPIYEILC